MAQAYVPLSFAPGEAYQFDWSHEIVVLNGVTVTVKVAHVRLCHSRMLFVRAYPRETQEMVFDTHDRAFAFFRGAAAVFAADDSPESRYVGAPVRSAPDLAALAGPLPHLAARTSGAEDPPLPAVAIAHGTADCTVAPGQSQLLVDALRACGVEPWVTWLDGAEHSDPRFDAELLAPTIDWLTRVLAR